MNNDADMLTATQIGRALNAVATTDERYLLTERQYHLENDTWGLALVQDRTGQTTIDWTVEYEVESKDDELWAIITVLDGSPEDVEESGRYVHGEARIRVHDDATNYGRKAAEMALSIIH